MSRILSAQFLGDMHHLLQHTSADARLEAVGGAQIHRAAQKALKVILQGKQAEQSYRAVEFHQQVHIAGGCGFIPRHRAKQRQRFDAVALVQVSVALVKLADHFLTLHNVLLPGLLYLESRYMTKDKAGFS